MKEARFLPGAFRRLRWPEPVNVVVSALRPRRDGLPTEEIATALYRGMLGREPDLGGLAEKKSALLRGEGALERVLRSFIASSEFRSRMLAELAPHVDLPDLTQQMPEMYRTEYGLDSQLTLYTAHNDTDIERMEALIGKHRYYDQFGVWAPIIDLDKEVTATIARGLGARSCFELGCFTGPVLSLLHDAGLRVAGAEVSHTAFTFAYPNVRDAILYGDLLDLDITERFDVVLCMDVLEHISPLRLGRYVDKIASLLGDTGYVYLNSPMFGEDATFGMTAHAYLEEWRTIGDASFWRHMHCDEKGWPQHGHLVWASPDWWTGFFERHGLVRDRKIEAAVHRSLAGFFVNTPARRSLFVLKRPDNPRDSDEAAGAVAAALTAHPGIPRPIL
jgi:SAM-dependent methyltransferase